MNDLTDPAGIAALSAGGVALIALLLALVLAVRVRRLRSAQQLVLGDHGDTDLVAHAASLQQAFGALHDRVEEVAATVDERLGAAEARLDGAIAYRSLVRYDAYGELTGNQSTTIARGQTAEASLTLGKAPPTGAAVTVKATVAKVPGEEKTDNNTTEYDVLFTAG